MNFHLDFSIKPFPKKLLYEETVFFMGSCFAENIAAQLRNYKFNTVLNPHGILYNPHSIALAVSSYIENKGIDVQALFEVNGVFHSWEHHSSFSHTDSASCVTKINEQIHAAHRSLKNAGWLFITFGSAYVYRNKKNGKRVGNCHKQPLQDFTKELLSIEEIVKEYQQLVHVLQQFNPSLKIVFTISPVRYIRDGIVENNRSKARLIEAVHQLTNTETVFYFPAYELILDDLRDYRFYKTDLLHPNEQAIDYVFEKLTQTLFDDQSFIIFEKVKEIIKAKLHRGMQENSQAHQQFKITYLNRCKQLQKEFPFLSLTEELSHFNN